MSSIGEWTGDVHEGDAFDVLAELPADSVHAVVTDPPYGLAFMGRDWDDFEPREYQQWCGEWAREAKRVLRPGGHLLAFSGNRTHHRLFTGVEDAGFEVRDTLTWHYGSGFPKALDVSKAIDKQRDDEAEQRVVCRWLRERIVDSEFTTGDIADHFEFDRRMVEHWAARDSDSQPSTPTLEQWRELKELIGFGDDMDPLVNWLNDRKGEPALASASPPRTRATSARTTPSSASPNPSTHERRPRTFKPPHTNPRPMSPEESLARFLYRAGTFLLVTAWLVGSGWFIFVVAHDVYARWGSWHTYPVPDKRAIKHVVGLLAMVAINLLFLWLAVEWFLVTTP